MIVPVGVIGERIAMKSASYSFDDIIFENRNKAYGAYELRQLSNRHNTYGLFISISSFILLVLLCVLFSRHTTMPQVLKHDVILNTSILDPIIPDQPKILHTSPPPVNTTAFTEINPVETTPVETNTPTQEQLTTTVISTTIVETVTPNNTTVTPMVETTPTVTTPVISTPVTWASVMPSFVGGEKALKEYLASHIIMHPADIENGISGRIVVRFYVDTDGSVKDATVIKDNAGGHCADVALAVISKMPKWNPGMQNNVPVKVYYTVPIKFEVKE